ncbi:FAD-dependent oxidoreductase [Candidatus Gracilibacteria bacterium]|nr:FAD-dependent oxidoreductase [Candidatus Gracilibacteria bacterium]
MKKKHTISRRALFALMSAAMLPPITVNAQLRRADVIVIGAGVAGLAAARKLRQANISAIVLEARTRVGGRVWTDRSWGYALDLGASWIHGVTNNPLSKLARDWRIATMPTDYEYAVLYDTNGRALSETRQVAIGDQLDALLEAAAARGERRSRDVALQTTLDELLRAENLSPSERRVFDQALNATIEHEYAADAAQLSLWHYDSARVFGGEDVLFPQGYDQIVRGLARSLDVRLDHVVRAVDFSKPEIRVSSSRGVYSARSVVMTLPLGVLKRGGLRFTPELPRAKQDAIAQLGMGLLNKVYLRFPRRFWQDEAELIGYIAERKGEWAEWLNIAAYSDEPVLLGFNAASYARKLETMSDTQVVAAAMSVLRTIYGSRIPLPEDSLITRWAADPYALGSYSFVAVGASGDDYDALADPVDQRLFFAGEATHRDYPSTVHGALLSGERAADEIIATV